MKFCKAQTTDTIHLCTREILRTKLKTQYEEKILFGRIRGNVYFPSSNTSCGARALWKHTEPWGWRRWILWVLPVCGEFSTCFKYQYEFDAGRNFTLAPFVNIHSYSRSRKWESKNYYYRETGFSIGAKGTYYFDALVNARPKWDFYVAASVGFMAVISRWDAGYDGDKDYYRRHRPLFLDFHLGAEYHVNNRLGIFFEFSTGVSSIGIAIHNTK